MDQCGGTLRWRGLQLCTAPGVLPPWYSTEAVVAAVENHRSLAGRRPQVVLDVGCGTGALGLFFARRCPGATVTLVDICPRAAAAAQASVGANRTTLRRAGSTAHVLCGDGVSALNPAFRPDFVLCNLPFDPAPPRDGEPDVWGPLSGALRDPGYRVHEAVLTDLARRLPGHGRVLLAASPTIGDVDHLHRLLAGTGLTVVDEVTFWFRTPRPSRPRATNAYSVLSLRRPPSHDDG